MLHPSALNPTIYLYIYIYVPMNTYINLSLSICIYIYSRYWGEGVGSPTAESFCVVPCRVRFDSPGGFMVTSRLLYLSFPVAFSYYLPLWHHLMPFRWDKRVRVTSIESQRDRGTSGESKRSQWRSSESKWARVWSSESKWDQTRPSEAKWD